MLDLYALLLSQIMECFNDYRVAVDRVLWFYNSYNMLGAYSLYAGNILYRVKPAKTRDLGSHGLL